MNQDTYIHMITWCVPNMKLVGEYNMADIIERIDEMLVEDDAENRLARWGKTFGKNHGKYPDEKGFHELCVTHMEGNIDDAPAYCARVKDNYMGSSYWRGKGKTKKEVDTAVKEHPNVKKGKREPA